MSNQWYEAVTANRTPLDPLPTEIPPSLKPLPGIKAVIFDIYGTLIISGSGDVGAADTTDRGVYLADAIGAAGIRLPSNRMPTIEAFQSTIKRCNDSRIDAACPKPEVDIVEVWRRTLSDCGADSVTTEQCNRVASEYESRANPTWPMPEAESTLRQIAQSGKRLGIVSNAQNFTLPLIEEIAGGFGGDSLFDLDLCVFSNRYRQAKPGPRLFDVLCDGLHRRGIEPAEAVYVGNDRLNDVWAASQAGLKTVWFAGDRRSVRSRDDDSRVRGLRQDVVLTKLSQLLKCLPT